MKKLSYLATVLAVIIALMMSVDDSISLYANANTTHIPFHTGSTDASHLHIISTGDHFFQKNSISFLVSEAFTNLYSFLKDQPEFNYFLSSIWQPPKKSC